MYRIVDVKPLPSYRVSIRFEDGTAGEVSLADLVGRGVFAVWNDPKEFARVAIDPLTYTLTWPGGIDLAPDALYEDIVTQKTAR